MAIQDSLKNLIEGLAGAVVEAQRRIETHQLNNILRFFDRDKRPKTIDLRLPSSHPQDKKNEEDVVYRVPYLSLVPGNNLLIKEVEMQFDAELTGVHDQEDLTTEKKPSHENNTKNTSKNDFFKNVQVDIRGGGMFKRRTGTVQVKLKVQGSDMSESMARLIDRLIQIQGDIEPK